MRSRLVGMLRFLASRGRNVCGPAADRVAGVDGLDDALKLCRAVLNVCGARLRQEVADSRAVFLGLGLKAEHLVRVLRELVQQLVFRLFSAHVAIVVRPLPMFKLARRVAMRHTLPDHDLDHEMYDVAKHVLQHDLHDAMNHD